MCSKDSACGRIIRDSGMFTLWTAAITFDLTFYAKIHTRNLDKDDVPDYIFVMCYVAFGFAILSILIAILARTSYGDDDPDDDENPLGFTRECKGLLACAVGMDLICNQSLIAAAAFRYLGEVEFGDNHTEKAIAIMVIAIPMITALYHTVDRMRACLCTADFVDPDSCCGAIDVAGDSVLACVWLTSLGFSFMFWASVSDDDFDGPDWIQYAALVAFCVGGVCFVLAMLLRSNLCCIVSFCLDHPLKEYGGFRWTLIVLSIIDLIFDELVIVACYVVYMTDKGMSIDELFMDFVAIFGTLFALLTTAYIIWDRCSVEETVTMTPVQEDWI